MRVRRVNRPTEDYAQCAFPKEQLREVGWKGYREKRSQHNGKNPETCMREASWEVDGRMLCTQHAGMAVLNHMETKS